MKLVILDRDGTINYDSPHYIKSPEEWVPIPGSLEAIAMLNHAGFQVVIATNQSGIGRGLFDMTTLNLIHDKMHRALSHFGGRIHAVFYCPHIDEDHCTCRKPRQGLLQAIADRYGVSLARVPSVGDSLRDMQVSVAVGALPMLVRTGKGEKTYKAGGLPAGTMVYADLAQAAHVIVDASR